MEWIANPVDEEPCLHNILGICILWFSSPGFGKTYFIFPIAELQGAGKMTCSVGAESPWRPRSYMSSAITPGTRKVPEQTALTR